MAKGKAVHPEGFITDGHVAVGFPLGDYLKSMGIKPKTAATTVHIPVGRFYQWIMNKRMPYSIFEYMEEKWGLSGFNMPKKQLTHHPYKVHPMFAKFLPRQAGGEKPTIFDLPEQKKPVPDTPPPAPAQPQTVTWEVYQATVQMLVEHASRLLSEKQIIDTENRRLQLLNDKLMAEQGLGSALQRLDAVHPIPAPVNGAVAPQQVTEAVRQAIVGAPLAIQRTIGDLESRLPKSQGSLH